MTFTLYPAIDIKGGECVRLTQGEMELSTVYAENPAAQAKQFEANGFNYLHIVDLDGAFQGELINETAVRRILENTNVSLQLGGGLRSLEVISTWLDAGISRVILGTIAQENPMLIREACRLFPGQIVVGIDARNGMVATEGWANQTTTLALDLALKFEDTGVAAIIYTDIMRDGTMVGPNVEETVALAEKLNTPVIASGGIRDVADVKAYIAHQDKGIEGVIAGKSIYEGTLDIPEVLSAIAA